MKRTLRLGTILALSLIFVFSAACFAPALALTTHTEHQSAGGTSTINVPGHPTIIVIMQHYEYGDFYRGSADRIQLLVSGAPSGVGPPFKFVASYEDNPARHAFSVLVGGGTGYTSTNLVEKCQIQVFRIGKTVFGYWTIPLLMPSTTPNPLGQYPTPAVTLPPGGMVFQGFGDAKSSGGVQYVGKWMLSIEGTTYDADATLFCPGWHYFGPGSGTWRLPEISTEATFTWTDP